MTLLSFVIARFEPGVIVLGDLDCSTSEAGLTPYLDVGLRDAFSEQPAGEDIKPGAEYQRGRPLPRSDRDCRR